ncbi:TatD family hydrolase [Pseudoalteromonas sp. MMG012]|uniref:TatD family hydrolase n=1 Tax=Pseudoalteromonas sp. MMG012 TaxID=2822686 RepID=UPI001B39DC26|nr:TatD family hydrolase [Pseudoalteromonas sp. MMG012]MBQ4851249.1 TatD family hydrolase [Pseudoalteromonas sp. MMG012]
MQTHYIDAGVNLTSSQYESEREDIVMRATQAGVSNMLLIGSNISDSQQSQELANKFGYVSTAGIHPHDAKDAPENYVESIKELLQHPEVVAVGECGLDFNRDFSPRSTQQKVCQQQLELARNAQVPVYLHERDAFDTMKSLLLETSVTGVLHCFTGNKDALSFYLEYGLYIGITGWVCDERRGAELQSLVPLIPDNKLLLETDAPYLLPRTLAPKPKSRRNEPAFIHEIANQVAKLRGQTVAHVAKLSQDNFERLFDKRHIT